MGNLSDVQSQTADKEEDLDLENVEIHFKWPYIVLICINMFIILPLCVHMTYSYYIVRDNYMYNARRPMLVIIFNIVAIIFLCLYTPIHIIIMEIYWENNGTYEEWWDSAFFFTAQICVFVTFAIRTWHSFYDFKLAHSISMVQWKSILNQRYRNSKTNFFLRYHKTLGEPRKTFLYFLIIPATLFFIIFITILVLEVGYNTEYAMVSVGYIYLIISVVILMYIITHTWRHVYDNIHLRGEILIGCVVLCITVILELIIFGVDLIEYSVENEKYQQVFNFSFNIVTCASCFVLIIVSTQYVRLKVIQVEKRQDRNKKERKKKQTDADAANSEVINKLITIDEEWIFEDEIDFQALISTPDGLKEFLEHLAKEYELNLLVFAMEVTQYQTHCIPQLIKREKLFVQQLESSLLIFPDNMPKSSLVYPPRDAPKTTDRRMFMELYEKYIHPDAEWKIRISSEKVNEIVTLYRRCQMHRIKKFSLWGGGHNITDDEEILSPIATTRSVPFAIDLNKTNAGASAGGHVVLKDLKAMVEALDGALNDVIATLHDSFTKYKQTEAFTAWFRQLTPSDRDIITRNYRHRKLIERTEIQKKNMADSKEWRCNHCTLMNRTIHINGRARAPKSICRCCGSKNNAKNVLLRTKTMMSHYWKHSKTKSTESMVSAALNPSVDFREDSLSLSEESKDEDRDIVAVALSKSKLVVVHLDPHIVKLWEALLKEIEDNEEDNECEGINSEYVDSCPKLQKLQFVMRCYNYYLNKTCKCDERDKEFEVESTKYDIPSMAELVNHLKDLSLQQLLDIYQHVSTVHFVPEMFDYFEESLGKCGGGKECKPLSRNNGRRGGNNRNINDRNRNTPNVEIIVEDNKEEKEEAKYEPFRALRRMPTVSKDIDYAKKNGKIVNTEERITLSYLDKWHSFLFHPNVKQKQENIVENEDHDIDEDQHAGDVVTNTEIALGSNSNKFVTDASKYGSLSKVTSTKINLLNSSVKGKSFDDVDDYIHGESDAYAAEYTYYEYGFGSQIEYHTLANHFVCMKQELIGNDVHTVTQKVWDDTLAKALLFLDMDSVERKYRANDHGKQKEYGTIRGEVIAIENVIAILFYCNFDELQNEFSKTFRKKEEYDTEQDIIERHCKNFYWFGRALFVAINFYGQRMEKNQVVWHGLSSRMLFEDLATHFDSPTSTTTQKNVAQTFSGNGCGIILQLKSKHNVNCAWMLDVSLFSDYTDECERLFLGETLIITDILTIIENRWVSFKNYIGACLYFNKITTGNAGDVTWNIKETEKIQNVLSKIIKDYMEADDGTISQVPHYIRVLFSHYCMKHTKPRFDDIDKIQYQMSHELQSCLFDTTIDSQQNYQDAYDKKQKISETKIKQLFPYITQYISDQKELVLVHEPEPFIDPQKSISLNLKSRKK